MCVLFMISKTGNARMYDVCVINVLRGNIRLYWTRTFTENLTLQDALLQSTDNKFD